jgi:catechol 2,3-dioxygenase-like lactoylglutathione lyase family enzyme
LADQEVRRNTVPRINITNVYVDDQEKALEFYTQVLGFVKKTERPMGGMRWLTVVSPAAPDGPELLLEPDSHPAVALFKRALQKDGIPFTRSPLMTPTLSTSACEGWAFDSHNSRLRWGR